MSIQRFMIISSALAASTLAGGQAHAQQELPEIVVRGASPLLAPWLQENLGPGAGVYGLDQSELTQTGGATLGAALSEKPGVSGSAFGPGANRPILRGLDNQRVRLQENGIGSMDVSSVGEDHGVPIDPLAAQRISILRGPFALRYGSFGIGGVIDAQNNRIPLPDTPEGARGETTTAVSSVDSGREGSAIAQVRKGAYAVHADFYRRRAGDYKTPHGTQANSALDMTGMAFGGSYIHQSGFFGLSISRFESAYGIPGLESAQNRTRIDMQQTKILARGEQKLDGSAVESLRFWFGASRYGHNEDIIDAGARKVMGVYHNDEAEGRMEALLRPVATPWGELKTIVGAQVGGQQLNTAGEAGGLLGPASARRNAAYAISELALSQRLTFVAGMRVEGASLRGDSVALPANYLPPFPAAPLNEARAHVRQVPVSVSAGLRFDMPGDWKGRLNLQRTERAPDALELFAKGPHEATGTFEIGDPNLRKENAIGAEIGLSRDFGPLRIDAALFHTRYQGYIYKRITGNTCGEDFDTCVAGDGEELKQIAYDQRDARFTGAEFAARYEIMPVGPGMFGFDGQFDIVRARFSDGANVPRIPPMRVGAGMFWTGAGISARLGLLHAFAQKRIADEEETSTSGYNLLRAELSYATSIGAPADKRKLIVGLTGTNLLNADVRLHTSFRKDEVLQPGRGVRAFVNVKF